jgi:hypothetical protein
MATPQERGDDRQGSSDHNRHRHADDADADHKRKPLQLLALHRIGAAKAQQRRERRGGKGGHRDHQYTLGHRLPGRVTERLDPHWVGEGDALNVRRAGRKRDGHDEHAP